MNLIHLKNFPILKQLQIEEALLRVDERNFCLINEGSPPAIVMGISGKPEFLIEEEKLSKNPIPIIKRFSGGGTVVVDEDTLFISFIFQKSYHDFPSYPEPILRWTESLYKEAFNLPAFHLRENDYVIGNHKCGGNAQYLRKERWLHHTTFLWDYQSTHMELLKKPPKTPKYRENRNHDAFLTRLSQHLPSKKNFLDNFKKILSEHYPLQEISLGEITSLLHEPHRTSTVQLS